jgi:hypothetical protein
MIGTLGPCLPHDLLEATGRHRGPLGWRLDRLTPRADQWLESKFPAWARSIVEDWVEGRFDDRETVIFSRGDDVVQRLYYYLCELQRRSLAGGPRALVFDVAKIPRATSVHHTTVAVRRLAAEFDLDDDALEAGIVAANRRRGIGNSPRGDRTCLLIGTPPSHRRLHDAVAAAGFQPVGPTLEEMWGDLGPRVEEGSGDPAAAIAVQVHGRYNDRRGFTSEAGDVLRRVEAVRPSAAVLWYTEDDEARIWKLPAVSVALAKAGLPILTLTRRDELAADDAPEQIRTFLEGVA